MKNNIVALLAVGLFVTGCASQPIDRDKDGKVLSRPNIIFILTDDQRFDSLGYAGNDIIQTPEMDKLAEEGVYFENALVTTPICSASRASFFSGRFERAQRYSFGEDPLKPEYVEDSYPKLMKDAGYYSGFYGKFGGFSQDFAGEYLELGYGTTVAEIDVGLNLIFSNKDLVGERDEAIVLTIGKVFDL